MRKRVLFFALAGVGLLAVACFASATTQPSSSTPTASRPPASTAAAPADAAATSAPSPSPAVSPAPQATIDGSVRYVVVPEGSEARYLVREQLADIPLPGDAVGSTKEISGAIVLGPDGAIIPEQSKITVDLRTLRSDKSRRDRFLQRRTLGTASFPASEVAIKEAPGLPFPLPTSGESTFQLLGDLTIRDVTRPVTWQVTAEFTERGMKGTATTSFSFDDFNLQQSRVALVLSVDETIRLELDFEVAREG